MFSQQFLAGRRVHLQNKRLAVEKSLREYGHTMPEDHKIHKITVMIPAIEKAIAKIDSTPEIYGYCEDCGEQIYEKRLSKLPESACCTKCQSEKEKSIYA